MHPGLSFVVVALLAFGVGFATHRGSICGILAARQIAETGKATRLVAFMTAALWALVSVVPLSWLAKGSIFLSPSYDISVAAFLGGALYGLGTFVNGGCVFGTVARISSGNLSFLAALPGIALGAGLGDALAFPHLAFVPLGSPLRQPGFVGFAVLMVAAAFVGWAMIGIVRTHRRAGLQISQVLRASRWRTSVAMMIIGSLGGLLFATGEPWSYSTFLRQTGNLILGQEARFAPATIIGPLAILAGAITAGALGGRFTLRTVSRAQSGRSLLGGATMGFATILVPGGNDFLLLSALPSLAMHGAVAYLAMMAVQLCLSLAIKQWKSRNMRKARAVRQATHSCGE
jgi:toxin CptA